MATLTKHDVQIVIEQARNRLMDHIATRQDVQATHDTVKGLMTLLNQNQHLLRQAESQSAQLVRRISALEARLMMLERQIEQSRRTLSHVADHKSPERVIISRPGERSGYVYSPA